MTEIFILLIQLLKIFMKELLDENEKLYRAIKRSKEKPQKPQTGRRETLSSGMDN